EWFAKIAFHVFLVGVLVLVSLLVHAFIDNPPRFENAEAEAWPTRLEPPHPGRRETVTDGRTPPTEPATWTQLARVPDERAAAWQQYWLGMVNTSSDLRPTLEKYCTENDDIANLAKAGFPQDALKPPSGLKAGVWKPEEFEKELNRLFPGGRH